MRPDRVTLACCSASFLFCTLLFVSPDSRAQIKAPLVSAEERAAFHQDPQWSNIEAHLPNPRTATAAQLETAADVLRARRFPHDALDYYGYAIARGGDMAALMNKMGILRLELQQLPVAHETFQQIVRTHKKDSSAWNNLGVTEYMDKRWRQAISDYQRAARLDKHAAVYRSNLGMAYFESGDMESARREFAAALLIDPHAFDHHGNGGSNAQVVGTQNYPQLAFEMARLYAKHHNDAMTVLWLAKSIEAGYDAKAEMPNDNALRPYMKDPRVLLIWKNTQQMRMRSVAIASPAPSLGESR